MDTQNLTPVTLVKPGYQTTEFWITITNNIVGIAVALGYLTPVQASDLSNAVLSVVGGLIVIVSTAVYVYGRIRTKTASPSIGTVDPTLLAQPGVQTPDAPQKYYPQ